MRRVLTVLGVLVGLLVAVMSPVLAAGDDEVGMVDSSTGRWHLREPNGSDRSFFYGIPGDIPLLGDWNCDGVDTPGMFRPGNGFFYLTDTNPPDGGIGVGEISFFFGIGGDLPVVGDWDGDGCDSVGIYRNGQAFLTNGLVTATAELQFYFGVPGDRPFAGDWNGDGIDTIGIYRNSSGQIFYSNENPAGPVATTANDFFYGIPSDQFIPGDWDGDGIDTVGIFRPPESRFYLRNINSTGPADETLVFGQSNWTPLGGDLELRAATLGGPASIELGPVGVNGSGAATFELGFVGDSGDSDLAITLVNLFGRDADEFGAAPIADVDIGFGETRTVEVTLNPDVVGVRRGFIRIRHTGVGSPLIIPLVGEGSYRVNAGGDPVEDWSADDPFSPGGNVGPLAGTSVSGPTAPDEVFESYRFGQQAWDFPVTPGSYRVNLYFAETFPDTQSAGARLFDVSIEGTKVLTNFDIFASAGANNGIVRTFDVFSDANLDIDLTQVVNSPAIQGIEIIPTPSWKTIGSSPSQATFGSIAVGDTITRTITVVHAGEPTTSGVNLQAAAIVGSDSGEFTVASGGQARTLASGASADVVVEYRPSAAGVADARLSIVHNGPNSPLEVDLIAAADDVIVYRLNAGGDAVIGQFSWIADDPYLVPGTPSGKFALVQAINTSDQSIPAGTPLDVLRTERFGSSSQALSYDLPLANGAYEVRLYVVEPVHNAAGIRVFDVNVEGALAVNDLDIYARAGKNKAIMIPIRTNVTGGVLDIDLIPIAGKNLPAVHGIEVVRKVGNAVLGSDPVSLTLGPISATGSTTGGLEILHTGGAGNPSIVIDSVSIGGPNAGRFALVSGPKAGDVFPPGVSAPAVIRFTAGWAGDKVGNLEMIYNGGSRLTVPFVGSVNDPPVVATLGNQSVNEGVAYSRTVTATDPDPDFLTMTVSGLPTWASIAAVDDGTITIGGTPGFGDSGISTVTVTATDPDGASDAESFTLTVANVNRPPTFNQNLGNRIDTEGDTVSISSEASDPDGNTLTWSATGLPQGIFINPTSGLISGTIGFLAGDNQPGGGYPVVVTVRDNGSPNLTATDTFQWTIGNQNRTPVASVGITGVVAEGNSVTVTLTAADADGDPLTFAAFAPVNGTVDLPVQGPPDQTATVVFNHDGSETTTGSFRFNASDGLATSVFATVNLTVTPVNDRPVATTGITGVVAEGGSVVVGVTAVDGDGDSLTFQAFAPVNGSIGAVTSTGPTSANVTFIHDGSETTSGSFRFNADDGTETSVFATVNLTVNAENDRPVATTGIIGVVAEGGTVGVTVSAVDGDGDSLTFEAFAPVNGTVVSVVDLPPNQATVVFTHNGSETTTGSFRFNASDGTETSVFATVDLTVTPVNDRPVATTGITGVVAEGGSVVVGVTAVDGDGDSLTFTAFAPVNGSIGAVTSTGPTSANVTFIHDGSETTSGSFRFNADDGTETSVFATVNLTVNAENDRPVATTGIIGVVAEGGTVGVTVSAVDGDGDSLTFEAFAPVNGTVVSVVDLPPNQATVVFTHNGSETTTGSFRFNASDGTETSVFATVDLTVTPVNDPPVLSASSYSFGPVAQGSGVGATVGSTPGTDPEGDSIAFGLSGAGNADFAIDSSGNITTAVTPLSLTSYSLTVTATALGGQDTAPVTISTSNGPPVLSASSYSFGPVAQGSGVGATVGSTPGTDPEGDSIAFGLSGAGNADFAIDSSGNITTAVTPLSLTSYSLTVTATALGGQDTAPVTISTSNGPPVFGASSYSFGPVAQGSGVGTAVGTVSATDPESDGISYSLTGGDSANFTVNGSGVITVNVGSLPAGPLTFSAVATAIGGSDSVLVTVSTSNGPPVFGASSYSFGPVAQGSGVGTAVGTVSATDPESDGISYSLTGGDSANFTVNGSGVITVNVGSLPAGPLTFSAVATAIGGSDSVLVTVSTSNGPPVFGASSYSFGPVAQGSGVGTAVGTVSATDPESDGISYSLTGGDSANFTVNGSGVITVNVGSLPAGPLTFSAVATAIGGSDSVLVTVSTSNGPPVFGASSYSFGPVAQGSGVGTAVGTVSATDPESDGISYSLTGGDSANFTVNGSGVITVNVGSLPAGPLTFSAVATAIGGSDSVLVTVSTSNGPPVFGASSYSFGPVAQGSGVGTAVGTVSATDPESDGISYSLTGGDSANFTVNGSGVITVNVGSLPAGPLTFSAVATAIGGSDSVLVTVSTSNGPPVFGASSYSFGPVAQGSGVGTAVGTVSATDPESDGISYSLTGGDSANFTVNGSGVITVNVGSLPAGPLTFSAVATAIGGSDSVLVTVSTSNGPPVFGGTPYSFSVLGTSPTGTSVGAVSATDPELEVVGYALTGAGATDFSIDGSGKITTAVTPLAGGPYNLTVVASTPTGPDATESVTISIT